MGNNSIRAGGVCVLDNKILLIHRINLEKEKDEQEYYVIPGGTVETDESIQDAVVREMKEETDVVVKVKDLFFEMQDTNPRGGERKQFYYMCEYVSGAPKLREDSEEAGEMKDGVHFYNPMWVELGALQNIKLFPAEIRDKILETFA